MTRCHPLLYTEEMNCTPFVRQYDILDNKWGALLCQKECQTKLWSAEDPNLYTCRITLSQNGKTLDEAEDEVDEYGGRSDCGKRILAYRLSDNKRIGNRIEELKEIPAYDRYHESNDNAYRSSFSQFHSHRKFSGEVLLQEDMTMQDIRIGENEKSWIFCFIPK